MVQYGPILCCMDPFSPEWFRMVFYGPQWSRMVLYSPIRSHMLLYVSLQTTTIQNKIWSLVSNSSLSKTFTLVSLESFKFRSYPKIVWLKFILGQKKNFGIKKIGPEKILIRKKFGSWKKFGSTKKFGFETNFASERNFGSEKKIWVWKILFVWTNFGSKKNLVKKNGVKKKPRRLRQGSSGILP